MLRCWLSLAILATVLLFTAAGGKNKPSRLIHGTCRAYAITRSFTMTRSTSNDTSNNTCTFSLPAFQCGGFCETFEQPKRVDKKGDVFELQMDEKCRCCEPIASGIFNVTIPANTLDCEENPGVKWDEEVVYRSVKGEAERYCTCRNCRSSNILPKPVDG